MSKYILRNKSTGRYFWQDKRDIFLRGIDLKDLGMATIFTNKEIKSFTTQKYRLSGYTKIINGFNIKYYDVVLYDAEVRKLKLKELDYKRRLNDFLEEKLK